MESRLSEITETPHPDLVEWFCFVDGYDLHPGISPGGGGDPLSLDEAISIWEWMQPEIAAGDYEHGRPTFVPFTRAAAVSCDRDRLFGAVVEFSTHAIQKYLPSLGHLCWYLIAQREEGVSYYLGDGLPLERVAAGFEERAALGRQFMIQRLLDESDDRVFPLGIG